MNVRLRAGFLITTFAMLDFAAQAAMADGPRTHDTNFRETLGGGQTLDVRNVSGSITLVQTDGTLLTVHAHATSTDADPASVRVELQHRAGSLLICVRYPGYDCGGDHDSAKSDVEVDLVIGVPRDRSVSAQTVDGAITAAGISDVIDASAVNGKIRLDTRGSVRAKTISGAIDATLALGPHDTGDFTAVNGGVRLVLARGTSATISAKTLNGKLRGHGVAFTLGNDIVGQSGTATLGGTGARISAQTVSGSIDVSAR